MSNVLNLSEEKINLLQDDNIVTFANELLGEKLGVPDFKLHWYQEVLLKAWARAILRNDTYVVNTAIPFQCGKSMMLAGLLVPLYLGLFPERSAIYCTYNEQKAKEVMVGDVLPALKSRTFVKYFGKTFSFHLTKEERNAVRKLQAQAYDNGESYEIENEELAAYSSIITEGSSSQHGVTTLRGGRLKVGSMAAALGGRADLLIVDDYFSVNTVGSEADMNKAHADFENGALSRLNERTLFVLACTRWMTTDITAKLRETMGSDPELEEIFEDYTFRAEKIEGEELSYDSRQAGELLIPSKSKAFKIAKNNNIVRWMASYQALPVDDEFISITNEDMPIVPDYHPKGQYVLSVDTSFSDKKGSDKVAVGVFVKQFTDSVISHTLVDLTYKRLNLDATITECGKFINYYPITAAVIEIKASGQFTKDKLKESYPAVQFIEAHPTISKQLRLQEVITPIKQKKLRVYAPFAKVYKEQLTTFTGKDGLPDDLVDITTQYLKNFDDSSKTGVMEVKDITSPSRKNSAQHANRGVSFTNPNRNRNRNPMSNPVVKRWGKRSSLFR